MEQALLVADRLGADMRPLTDHTCIGLLPVAAKPMIEYALEALVKAGIKRVLVLISPHADEVQRVIGDGARWGLRFTYSLTRGEEDPRLVINRLGEQILERPFVALRGDVLHGFDIADWLATASRVSTDRVWASADGRSAACGIHRAGSLDLEPLIWPLVPRRETNPETFWIPVAADAFHAVDSLAEYHRANLDAAGRRLPGLILPGRAVALGLTVGRDSRVAPRSLRQGVCVIGNRCRIAADAELSGEVVISDDVIVDHKATIHSSVILPHTYVGELVEVSNAIVRGNTMVRIDTGAVLQVTDTFLLANLHQTTLTSGFANATHRLLGFIILVISLPLWAVAILAAASHRQQGWLLSAPLRGNRRWVDGTGQIQRRDIIVWEWNTRIPILRGLPRLLAVVTGDLRLVGVAPLSPTEADALIEDWERIREEAPAGLIGPTQLDVPATAPREERLMSDAFYARQRRPGRDLAYLLRGVMALFHPTSWRPDRATAAERDVTAEL